MQNFWCFVIYPESEGDWVKALEMGCGEYSAPFSWNLEITWPHTAWAQLLKGSLSHHSLCWGKNGITDMHGAYRNVISSSPFCPYKTCWCHQSFKFRILCIIKLLWLFRGKTTIKPSSAGSHTLLSLACWGISS